MKFSISNGKNQHLDLYPKLQFQIEIKSPIYFGSRSSSDQIPNVKTYQLRIPDSAHNRLILDRPDSLDNPEDLHESTDWYIYFERKLIFQGTAKVTKARKHSGYDFQFIGGLAGSLSKLKSKKLNEYTYGGERTFTGGIVQHASATAAFPQNYDYLFPPVYLGANHDTGFDYINNWDNSSYKGIDSGALISTFIPCLKVKYILTHLLSESELTLDGIFNVGDHATELSNLILFNTVAHDIVDTDPPSYGPDIINLSKHVPEIKASIFINNICMLFCASPFLDLKNNKLHIKANKDLLNQAATDWTNKTLRYYSILRRLDIPDGFEYLELSAKATEAWNKLPDAVDFKTVATVSHLETNILKFDTEKDYNYVTSQNTYYKKQKNATETAIEWVPFHQILDPYNENAENPLLLNIGTLQMNPRDTNETTTWFNSPLWFESIKHPKFTGSKLNKLCLLFSRGLQSPLSGNDRPLFSNNVFDDSDTQISGANLSLLWNGTNGLYETWWKDWLSKIESSKPVEFSLLLNATDLEQLDLSNKYRIGQHDHFIKKLQITITANEIKPVIAEMIALS